jgi:hypothetical protein
MSDRHVRLLRAVARRRQQQSEAHAASPADAGPVVEGSDLRRAAARTRAHLSAAQERRSAPSEPAS